MITVVILKENRRYSYLCFVEVLWNNWNHGLMIILKIEYYDFFELELQSVLLIINEIQQYMKFHFELTKQNTELF